MKIELQLSDHTISQRILKASERLKSPSHDPNSNPTHKYLLRGVIPKAQCFFVLERAESDIGQDSLISQSVPGHQWWRIEFDRASATPVQVTKVSEEDTLKAASSDSPKVTLVYASERASEFEDKPLPSPLHNFVRADNLAFQAELDSHRPQVQSSTYATSLSPQKRKVYTDTYDSDMEVERGDSPEPHSQEEFRSGNSSPLDPNPSDEEVRVHTGNLPSNASNRARPLEPKVPARGYDDLIPLSARDDSQEMQESGTGLLNDYSGKSKFGSHIPDMKMDIEDDDEGCVEGEAGTKGR